MGSKRIKLSVICIVLLILLIGCGTNLVDVNKSKLSSIKTESGGENSVAENTEVSTNNVGENKKLSESKHTEIESTETESIEIENSEIESTVIEANEIESTETETTKTESTEDVSTEDVSAETEAKEQNTEVLENIYQVEYTYTDISKTMYAKSAVNVRNLPSTKGSILGSLTTNQETSVNGQCNETGWYRIDFNGSVGYVSNNYIIEQKMEEAQVAPTTLEVPDSHTANQSTSWDGNIANLNIAGRTNQLIIVSYTDGSNATVSMHNKNGDGTWSQLFSVNGKVGRYGIGKSKEGDGKTPIGTYGFTTAFGNAANPGCSLGYTQCDSSWYWVDDSNSSNYNRFVSTNNVVCDWNSAEHINSVGAAYNYVLALNYNSGCTPGLGSAIFLHCGSSKTAGCIAIPESNMLTVMQNVQPGCIILIDYQKSIGNY